MSGNGGKKALELLRSLPRVSLANLRPNPGSKKQVSACSLSGESGACFAPGGRTLPRQRPRPAPVAFASRAVRKPRGRIGAGPGEPPGQNRRGKAEGWVAAGCALAPFAPFACLVAGVCGCPHRELG